MYDRPDYATARSETGFGWSCGGGQGALRQITGTPIREFNLDPATCIECYRTGRPMLHEMFGDDVSPPSLSTPAISYGHPSCLGSELLFPEGGEVGQTHIYKSLEEGIAALKQPVKWAEAGMAPFYLDFRARLQEAFPGEAVGLAFGAEGPLTSAYELRGDGFFTDLHDAPELAGEFLRVLVDSIVDYDYWYGEVHGNPRVSPHGAGMVDDVAAFIPPALFPRFVLPYWEQYYSALTTGKRSAHVEDLTIAQLPFLEDIGLCSYDPSISPRLTPPLITQHCRVPYVWRLGEIHFREMTVQETSDFVFMAAADGANGVTTVVAEETCNDKGVTMIHAFIAAGKEAKLLLDEGCSREELRDRVSAEGKARLWERWCGYNGPLSSRGGARG
ncbi:MAG: hypothetical protein WCP21_21335 [Armatimonadota bacterium]